MIISVVQCCFRNSVFYFGDLLDRKRVFTSNIFNHVFSLISIKEIKMHLKQTMYLGVKPGGPFLSLSFFF